MDHGTTRTWNYTHIPGASECCVSQIDIVSMNKLTLYRGIYNTSDEEPSTGLRELRFIIVP